MENGFPIGPTQAYTLGYDNEKKEIPVSTAMELMIGSNEFSQKALDTAISEIFDISDLAPSFLSQGTKMSRYFAKHTVERDSILGSAREYLKGLSEIGADVNAGQKEKISAYFKKLVGEGIPTPSTAKYDQIVWRFKHLPQPAIVGGGRGPTEVEQLFFLLIAILYDLDWTKWKTFEEFYQGIQDSVDLEKTLPRSDWSIKAWRFASGEFAE